MQEELSHDHLQRLNELERVVRVTDANYTARYGDDIILVTVTSTSRALVLTAPRGGLRVTVVKRGGGGNLTITAAGGALINGAASYSLTGNYAPLRFKAIGGEYISV